MRSCFALVLILAACTESVPPGDNGVPDGSPDARDAEFNTMPPIGPLQARIYLDTGGEDRTRRNDGFDDDDIPQAGRLVRTLGTAQLEAVTNDSGLVAFDVAPGHYLFDADVQSPTTHNHAPNLIAAVRRGAIKVTTLGDSLPVVGGPQTFDAVLESHLSALGTTVNRRNIAVSGSTSEDWGEGTTFFSQAASEAGDTDLFIVSLGGNDFLRYVQNLFASGGAAAVLDALNGAGREEALRILERVLAIIEALRVLQPNADFVFLVYANYPDSNNWRTLVQSAAGSLADTAQRLIENEYRAIMRQVVSRLENETLVLADVLNQTRAEPIDPFLIDELHFTPFGHQRIGEEIFLSLGGAIVGENPELHPVYDVGLSIE